LYNLSGELIEHFRPEVNNVRLIKANYLSGVYTLILKSNNGSELSKKIIIN
jgi:hypothetical protein